MSSKETLRRLTRREALLGTGAALAAARATSAAEPSRKSPSSPRFEIERFLEDCQRANTASAGSQQAVQEVMARAFSNPGAVLSAVGEPKKGGIQPLYRSAGLTILNIVWSPLMQLIPHEHNMWSLIGIYTGREDNIFWQRQDDRVIAIGAKAISAGGVTALSRDVIHSVSNPIEKLTGAIHIYGGDFFATPRSEWDPETLAERDWSLQRAVKTFTDSNERFFGAQKNNTCR